MSDGIVKKLVRQFHEVYRNVYDEKRCGQSVINYDLVQLLNMKTS